MCACTNQSVYFFVRFFGSAVQPASYGKKNGMWYASPGNQGWGTKSLSRKASVVEASDIGPQTAPTAIKPSAGRVIRIINSLDHSVQVTTTATTTCTTSPEHIIIINSLLNRRVHQPILHERVLYARCTRAREHSIRLLFCVNMCVCVLVGHSRLLPCGM